MEAAEVGAAEEVAAEAAAVGAVAVGAVAVAADAPVVEVLVGEAGVDAAVQVPVPVGEARLKTQSAPWGNSKSCKFSQG